MKQEGNDEVAFHMAYPGFRPMRSRERGDDVDST
jgi:hypothetical protein